MLCGWDLELYFDSRYFLFPFFFKEQQSLDLVINRRKEYIALEHVACAAATCVAVATGSYASPFDLVFSSFSFIYIFLFIYSVWGENIHLLYKTLVSFVCVRILFVSSGSDSDVLKFLKALVVLPVHQSSLPHAQFPLSFMHFFIFHVLASPLQLDCSSLKETFQKLRSYPTTLFWNSKVESPAQVSPSTASSDFHIG